jgi:hypothetical protein
LSNYQAGVEFSRLTDTSGVRMERSKALEMKESREKKLFEELGLLPDRH